METSVPTQLWDIGIKPLYIKHINITERERILIKMDPKVIIQSFEKNHSQLSSCSPNQVTLTLLPTVMNEKVDPSANSCLVPTVVDSNSPVRSAGYIWLRRQSLWRLQPWQFERKPKHLNDERWWEVGLQRNHIPAAQAKQSQHTIPIPSVSKPTVTKLIPIVPQVLSLESAARKQWNHKWEAKPDGKENTARPSSRSTFERPEKRLTPEVSRILFYFKV